MVRGYMRSAAVAAILSSFVLGGCTTRLSVAPLTGSATPVGAPFPLYFDQFRVSINYQLAKCDSDLIFKTSVEVVERIRSADPEHSYVIDPNSLAAFNKTAEATIKYFPNGMPSSINAKADDRTAEIAGSLIKSAAGIAKLVAGGGGMTAVVACTTEADAAIKELDRLTQLVKTRTAVVKSAQEIFDKRKAQIDAAGAAIPSALRKQFTQDYMALQGALQGLADSKKALDAAKKALSISVALNWPRNGVLMSEEIVPTSDQLAPLFNKWLKGGAASVSINPADLAGLAVKLEIEAEQPNSPYVQAGGSRTLPATDLAKGIPYRNPYWGLMRVRTKNETGAWEVSEEKRYEFLQLGRVFVLPCVSKPLTSISCSLAFNENGRVSEAGTTNSKAPGEVAAGLLSTAVTEVAGVKTALDGRALKDKQAELALLEIDGKIAAARKAQVTAPPTQKQQWEDEIAMLDTERRLIEGRRALDEAKSQVEP
jgi:hypothetical protein